MSSMASEIQRRIDADGGAGLEPGTPGAPAPGTGETTGSPDDSSAGTSNTDTSRQGPPDTIPYSRFAEVNTALQGLKPYEQLHDLGIEPDSAVRLANFERAWQQDPNGVWLSQVDSLDLPDGVKEGIKALMGNTGSTEGAPAGDGDGAGAGDPGTGATSYPPEVQEAVDYVKSLREREATQESDQKLDLVIGHWKKLDEADGIKTPDRIILTHIQAAAPRGGYTTLEELAEMAREPLVEYRAEQLGGLVQQRRSAGLAPTVPGGAAPGSEPVQFRDLRSASRAAEADIKAGRLPAFPQQGG